MNMELSATVLMIGIMMSVIVHTTISMTTAATESIGETGCNETWTPEGQGCYLHVLDIVNFTQANRSCQELGAHLVFIGSEEENIYIQGLVGGNPDLWIGLYRPTNESCAGRACKNWMWLNGGIPQYSHWAGGLFNTPGQCAYIDSQGDWDHSRACSWMRPYVCEQRRIFPSTTQEPPTMRSTRDIIHPTSSEAEGIYVSTTDVDGGNNGDGNIPLIVGCVVGGLVLIGIIIAVVVLLKRHRNTSKSDQPTREKVSKSPKCDTPSKKDRNPSQRDKPKKHKDRKSTPKNQSKNYAIDDERPDGANGTMNRGYSYEDVELGREKKGLKQVPANSATGAHGGGFNPEHIYAEPLKKTNRPVSEGVEVQENPLYGSGK